MFSSILLIFLCGFCVVIGQEITAPVITISDGELQGIANLTVRENLTYYAYRGIPFAKSPVGDLRFAAPVKNDPWTGTLDATKDRDVCVQIESSSDQTVSGSEDCLHINVYTTNISASMPVMVWIYGGSFVFGSSEYINYAPDRLIEKGVVFVSFNYRLGVFGFLSTEDMEATGNWGIKDQVLALKWVKENIKNFGGDPNQVTLFGESAGAASVSYLVQSNLTEGLFQRAIMESGTTLSSWALARNPRNNAFLLALKLSYVTLSTKELVEHLRTIDATTLKLAEKDITNVDLALNNLFGGSPFAVVQEPDHPDAVLSSKSWELMKNGNFNKVPLIVGFNSDEAAYFADIAVKNFGLVLLKYDILKYLLAPYDLTENLVKKEIAGSEVSDRFFGTSSVASNATLLKRFIALDYYWRPTREFVTLASKYTNTYLYQFDYKGLLGGPIFSNYSGVVHSEELYYLFVFQTKGTDKDYETSQKFVTLWTNFAKTGNPTPSPSDSTILDEVTWIPNNSTTNNSKDAPIQYLHINDTLYMDTNPFQADWKFYEALYEKYGDPPYGTY